MAPDNHPHELVRVCGAFRSRASTATRSLAVLGPAGIPARPYFLPIHLQPYMVERFGYQEGDFPVTEDLGQRGLALPFSGVMSEAQVDQVCQALRAVLTEINSGNRINPASFSKNIASLKSTAFYKLTFPLRHIACLLECVLINI